MREYRRKRRQAALLKAREEEARQRIETTKTSRKFYMREYRRKRQQMALVEVEDTKARQCEEIYENVRKECTKNEPRNGQQATQAEMKKIEEEGENSRTQYMQENRRNPRRRRITGIKGQWSLNNLKANVETKSIHSGICKSDTVVVQLPTEPRNKGNGVSVRKCPIRLLYLCTKDRFQFFTSFYHFLYSSPNYPTLLLSPLLLSPLSYADFKYDSIFFTFPLLSFAG
ncbi:hypothetical protein PHYBLDRAFT_188480 [Phycomyces blakesleeanus NRRL 1555(-)]|uniref:Uncharacterized protein n=1 Tax=Phycomyces blakesleeanus (strain ATCC 8743b / DSM 1359 / FGSC 10004 / NBRC 33097 / NRRL 1555) TaxID=763407 RepID=A0A167KTG9_PHYB8|nr:hypothetical protein PHYBLDRAFT_188480 [Phycomyces blakesleeanus NRRL 1555(-)]OAD68837.1 hypothetical protein PHYBLDRAFT_188480 [Phycomyces blakesleeanus NRRL 1555(-)]|eukprot:XP_018286877.1 hypothetical protein PHYBLDRAFT_188480 [Phycomyces blakesleeanus NRRL 1555(-)]